MTDNTRDTAGSVPSGIDPDVLSLLACPACHGELRPEPASLVCQACARRYPLIDGIPVLIPGRAQSA